jgi:hypothetical protein
MPSWVPPDQTQAMVAEFLAQLLGTRMQRQHRVLRLAAGGGIPRLQGGVLFPDVGLVVDQLGEGRAIGIEAAARLLRGDLDRFCGERGARRADGEPTDQERGDESGIPHGLSSLVRGLWSPPSC